MKTGDALIIILALQAATEHRLKNGPVGPDLLYDIYVDRHAALTAAVEALREKSARESKEANSETS